MRESHDGFHDHRTSQSVRQTQLGFRDVLVSYPLGLRGPVLHVGGEGAGREKVRISSQVNILYMHLRQEHNFFDDDVIFIAE